MKALIALPFLMAGVGAWSAVDHTSPQEPYDPAAEIARALAYLERAQQQDPARDQYKQQWMEALNALEFLQVQQQEENAQRRSIMEAEIADLREQAAVFRQEAMEAKDRLEAMRAEVSNIREHRTTLERELVDLRAAISQAELNLTEDHPERQDLLAQNENLLMQMQQLSAMENERNNVLEDLRALSIQNEIRSQQLDRDLDMRESMVMDLFQEESRRRQEIERQHVIESLRALGYASAQVQTAPQPVNPTQGASTQFEARVLETLHDMHEDIRHLHNDFADLRARLNHLQTVPRADSH